VYLASDPPLVNVQIFAEGPQDERDQIEAAAALGGICACADLIKALLLEAQGKIADGTDHPEEKV